ncbi:MAG: PD40 domain-containing protein, partial [Alistipes sp.]|nr:PD40 domain-containing protein [Alistipes sp.]
MMKKLFLALLLAGGAVAVQAEEARLLRFPATNGKDVVFTYAGDLYRVPIAGGEATRLTSHVGTEMFARFSPDGQQIAFTAQYDGNTEVYLMPKTGGEPERLTYTATNERDDIGDRMGPNNIVMTWTRDGKNILYRNRISDGFSGKLWSVSKEGDMPEQLPLPEGGFCSYSPDGKKLAYNRVMREFRTWKYYKGGMADDVWVYDPASKKVENVTNNVSQDIFPMWIGEEIFFISDRDRTMNLFVYNTSTKKTEKVTNYSDYDIKFPSTDGSIIVYEQGGYIFKFDPKTRKAEKISITLNGENRYARVEMKNVDDKMTAASLSPDGKRVAVTARGEVFNVPVEKGVTRNITRTSGANERGAKWSPDGKWIAYISDRTGETEVWLQGEDGEPQQLTKGSDTYIRQVIWSPDSKTLLYTDRKNRLVAVDVASKSKQTLMQNPNGEPSGVAYSPDSKWLTYTKSAENEMSVIYVYNIATKKEYPVTERWYSSSAPVFSTDGKYLIFTSARDFNSTYSQTEWNHVYTRMNGVYMAMLAEDTPSPLLPTDGAVDAAKKSEGEVVVKIDPENLPGRIVKLPLPAGSYRNFYSDGKKVYY